VLNDAKGETKRRFFGCEECNIAIFQGLNFRCMVRCLRGQLFKNGLEQDMLMQVIPELDQRAVEQRRIAGIEAHPFLKLEPLRLQVLKIHDVRA